ncbi:MAG: sulfotransferase [Balneolaceae bacterium]|nr:sulfotransferase [Balneolaceae bacterium]
MNHQIAYKDLQNTEENLFFIAGTSRSGSTLLQSMLNSHSEVVIPPETHFFHSFKNLKKQYNVEFKNEFRGSLLDFWYDQKTRIRDLGLAKEQVKNASEELDISSPIDLFLLQMTMYRKERGKSIIGEKTPRHILQITEILEEFPKAKVIAMFRDPRAAANSEIKAHFGSPSVIVTTKRWRKYIAMHQQLQNKLASNQYMMLRYCDLIEDPESVLKKVSNFLGIEFQQDMLNYYERDEKGFAEGEKEWKEETLEPLKKNKNEEWKDSLENWQVALVEQQAGKYLEEMGYKPSGNSLSTFQKIIFSAVDFGKSVWATITNARDEGYNSPAKFKF